MNVDEKNKRDSITKFSFSCENIIGNYVPKKSNYDLMTGVLICVSNKVSEDNIENNRDSEDSSLSEEETITKKGPKSENNKILEDERKLIGLLKTLFSNELSQTEKKESLQNNYDIQVNETIDKELMSMCNLGYGVYERGIECGLERGLEQGLERGEIRNMLHLVEKKYRKGKSCHEIANELETDLYIIEQIYEVLEHAEMDASEKELVDILVEKNILQHMV